MLNKKDKKVLSIAWTLFLLWCAAMAYDLTFNASSNDPWRDLNYTLSVIIVVVVIMVPLTVGTVAKAQNRIKPSPGLNILSKGLIHTAWVIPLIYFAVVFISNIEEGISYSEYYAENRQKAEHDRLLKRANFLNDPRTWYTTDNTLILSPTTNAQLKSQRYSMHKQMQDEIDYKSSRGIIFHSNAGILETDYEVKSAQPYTISLNIRQIQEEPDWTFGRCDTPSRCETHATNHGSLQCDKGTSFKRCRLDINNQSFIVQSKPALSGDELTAFMNALVAKKASDFQNVKF